MWVTLAWLPFSSLGPAPTRARRQVEVKEDQDNAGYTSGEGGESRVEGFVRVRPVHGEIAHIDPHLDGLIQQSFPVYCNAGIKSSILILDLVDFQTPIEKYSEVFNIFAGLQKLIVWADPNKVGARIADFSVARYDQPLPKLSFLNKAKRVERAIDGAFRAIQVVVVQ